MFHIVQPASGRSAVSASIAIAAVPLIFQSQIEAWPPLLLGVSQALSRTGTERTDSGNM
jgi:hypothetical protein